MKIEDYVKAKELVALSARITSAMDSVVKQIEIACKKAVLFNEDEPIERPILRRLEEKLMPLVRQHFAEELEKIENEFKSL